MDKNMHDHFKTYFNITYYIAKSNKIFSDF
jgi:hypothetical protein